jgi:signal transduction histidine kinase
LSAGRGRSFYRFLILSFLSVLRAANHLEHFLIRVYELHKSLTNMHRHSKSSSVDVHLRLDAGKVIFEVRDYGKGIPHALLERFRESGQGAGIGLSSMRERVDELGGEFEIQSDGGTLIRVVLPWHPASAGKAAAEGSVSDSGT